MYKSSEPEKDEDPCRVRARLTPNYFCNRLEENRATDLKKNLHGCAILTTFDSMASPNSILSSRKWVPTPSSKTDLKKPHGSPCTYVETY